MKIRRTYVLTKKPARLNRKVAARIIAEAREVQRRRVRDFGDFTKPFPATITTERESFRCLR
jgi:hypothetical protein